jgi:uncharacterized repeat protein (TIGR01451 family)
VLLPHTRRALAAIAVLAALSIAGSVGSPVRAQQAGVIWQFEHVAPLQLPNPACKFGMTIAGFEYDPQGRPVVGWREENDCGGGPDVFWTRKENGAWHQNQFLSERRFDGGAKDGFYHQLILRPSDGNPFLVYRDVVPGNSLYTTRTDLGAYPNGGVSDLLEFLVGPQHCAYVDYSLAFSPGAPLPDWLRGMYECNFAETGPITLNGVQIGFGGKPHGSLAVTPDGVRHVLWNMGNELYYTRWTPGAAAPITFPAPIFTNINRLGGEVKLMSDATGVLHATVRGVEGDSADFDKGAVIYMTSADGGQSWSPFEYVDPADAVPGSIGVNTSISMALDANHVPAVTYWRSNQELWYARRDGPGGTWTRSMVTIGTKLGAPRSAQVRFDPNGQPVVALYDMGGDRVVLATPVPFGSVPIDVGVTGTVTPEVSQPGAGLLSYTLTVTNRSTVNVDNVSLTNMLPAAVALVDASPSPASPGRWNLGSLTPGASARVTIRATAPATAGALSDIASVTSDGVDADPANNTVAIRSVVRPAECFVPAAGLTDLWRGESTMLNAVTVPVRSDAWVVGTLAYPPAVVGRGFALNGSTSLSADQIYTDNSLFPPEGSLTLQAWVATIASTGIIASRNEFVYYWRGNSELYLYLNGGRLSVTLEDVNGNVVAFEGTRVVNDGTFHHVALVIDRAAAEARIYVDGTVDGSAPFTLGEIGHNTRLVIGAGEGYTGVRGGFLTGILDEVAVHNRALSATELAAVVAAPSLPQCGANAPPVVTNPGDQGNVEGNTVSLPISASDADGDALTFTESGLPTGLSIDASSGVIGGVLPAGSAGVYAVTVTVSDGKASASASFYWTVTIPNRPPTLANPGPQTNAEGDSVTLPLIASDPDGDTLTFGATGLPPGLSIDPATGKIAGTITAGSAASYPVTASVTDGQAATSQSFTWTVLAPPTPPPPGNRAPVCSSAGPSVGVIWPPNHKLVVPVTINGVVDPDGDPVTISITRILQDEPTNVTGDGNTPTDGFGVGTSTAQVRAERTGTPKVPGNGRVYEIEFRAVDTAGAACTGTVMVGVPHDQNKLIVDDLIRYDSTVADGGRVR